MREASFGFKMRTVGASAPATAIRGAQFTVKR
jgi:hypothetical protein